MSAYVPNVKYVLSVNQQWSLLFIRMPSSGTKIVVWTSVSSMAAEMSVQEALRSVSGNVPVRYSTANINSHVHQGHYCIWDVSFLQNMFPMPGWQSVCRSLPYDSHSLRAYWFNQCTNQLSSQYSAHQRHFTFFLSQHSFVARITSWLHDDSFCLMLISQTPHFEFILSCIMRTLYMFTLSRPSLINSENRFEIHREHPLHTRHLINCLCCCYRDQNDD